MRLRFFILLLGLWAWASEDLSAMQDQSFGLGGMSSGRVGSIAAETDAPFGALINPALLSSGKEKRFAISSSYVGSAYSPFGTVVVDGPGYRTRDGSLKEEETTLGGISTSLFNVSYTHPLALPFWSGHQAGVGLVVSGPFGTLRSFDAPSPYDFTTLRYGTSDTQFKANFGGAVELVPKRWNLGVSLSSYVTSAGISDTALAAGNPTARMKMDVTFRSSLIAGSLWSWGKNNVALVYRQKLNPIFVQSMVGAVEFGGRDVVNQPMTIESALYYEPELWELDWQRSFGDLKLSLGISYQRWSDFVPYYLVVQATATDGSVKTTNAPNIPMSDTWVPRISAEFPLASKAWTLGVGYQYRPTPVGDLSGTGNLLDSMTHVMGANLRVRLLQDTWGFQQIHGNLFGQYHIITGRNITKAAMEYVGAPGYRFEGNVVVVGVGAEIVL